VKIVVFAAGSAQKPTSVVTIATGSVLSAGHKAAGTSSGAPVAAEAFPILRVVLLESDLERGLGQLELHIELNLIRTSSVASRTRKLTAAECSGWDTMSASTT
jgi:hypothetical protein